jgi:hypothetical protein
MYRKYGGDVQFYIVYIREAHSTDERQVRANARQEISVMQPTTFVERVNVAQHMCHKLDISISTLIDGIDNAVGTAYSSSPDRLYLVGRSGKIVYKGDRGPSGFRPAELETAIKEELAN